MLPHSCLGPTALYDPESAACLGIGETFANSEAESHPFQCLRGNGSLLTYYFGKGKREVVVRSAANEEFTAQLATRWAAGHREWILDAAGGTQCQTHGRARTSVSSNT